MVTKKTAGDVPEKSKASKQEASSVVKVGNQLRITGRPGNVAEYLILQINASGKSQAQIAKEVGFSMPNMITMLKKNLTKLPIDKVGKMAKSLGVDPIHLYKLCMAEYYPDTWVMIQGFLDQPTLTENELEFINILRQSNVVNPRLRTEDEKVRLLKFVNGLKGDEAKVEG